MTRRLVALALGALAVGVSGSQGAGTRTVAATVVPSPLSVALALRPTKVSAGRTAKATAVASNLGTTPVTQVELGVRIDPTGLSVAGQNPRTFAGVAADKSVDAAWRLCAGAPAVYVVVAQARGRLPSGGPASAESPARLLTVTGPPRAC